MIVHASLADALVVSAGEGKGKGVGEERRL